MCLIFEYNWYQMISSEGIQHLEESMPLPLPSLFSVVYEACLPTLQWTVAAEIALLKK